MIEGLILERTYLYATARADVGNRGGKRKRRRPDRHRAVPIHATGQRSRGVTVNDELYLLPEQLEFTGKVASRELRRADLRDPRLHGAPRVAGTFRTRRLDSEYEDLAILWEQAAIALPITDARSVREPIVLASGDGTTIFEAGGARVAGFGPQLVAPYAALGLGPLAAPQAFSFSISCSAARAR